MFNLIWHTFNYFSQFKHIDIELHFAPALPQLKDGFIYIQNVRQYFNNSLQPTYYFGANNELPTNKI